MGDKIFPKRTFELETTADLLQPILKLIGYHPLIPNQIDFNKDTNEFFRTKGGFLRRIIACIWTILMITYISLILISGIRESNTTTGTVGKISWGTYTIFDVAFIICFWADGDKIAQILNSGGLLMTENKLKITRMIPDKLVSKIGCAVVVVFVGAFVIFVITNNLIGSTTDLFDKFLVLTGAENGSVLNKWCGHSCNLFERSRESFVGAAIFGTWLAVSYSVEFVWVSFLVLMTGWGIYFKRLMHKCVEGMEKGGNSLKEEIQRYISITNLLDDFNSVFGSALFWGVLSLGFYIAFIVAEFMSNGLTDILTDVTNLLSVVPFLTMLIAGAEIHRVARKLPNSIKRSSIMNKYTVLEYLDVIQGTIIMQFDALSNDIGFKGLGFFTISYKFVAHLAGLVFTYSLVTLQFKRAERLQ